MNQSFKTALVFFTLISSTSLFAQEDISANKHKKSFKPKFTIGSGIYTLTGDIQSEETGLLKGKGGLNVGMKFDLGSNFDLSFLFAKTSFSASNDVEQFSSNIDGLGLHLGYNMGSLFKTSKINPVLSVGLQRFAVSTNNEDLSSAILIPAGLGLRMNVTDRLQFDVSVNFAMGMSDIDMSEKNNSDGYRSFNFILHYDLFTRSKDDDNGYFDETYYEDVDFAKLESEDEDGDLIADMDDYCPETPVGVKVDENGCPLDDDRDGIPNYLDQQKDTPEGSLVDENGIRLSADQYQSMYSEVEIASRKYANFYNESEIKRENYKTIDEYLIAKANAFNKAYNESLNEDMKVSALIYRLKIGEFRYGIEAREANKLLSFDDLKSILMDDGTVIYTVGNYSSLDAAIDRQDRLFAVGFDDSDIVIDNNGDITDYIPPVLEPTIDEDKMVVSIGDTVSDSNIEGIVNEQSDENISSQDNIVDEISGITYRVQIKAAFEKPLSDEVFRGVDDVISFTGKDGWFRYMVGSFSEYKDAVDYQAQMRLRGHSDAFIVTYKDGERISLNTAIKKKNIVKPNEKSFSSEENEESIQQEVDLKFTVQVMVNTESVSSSEMEKMANLGVFDKKAKGSDMYVYYAGTYSTLEEANMQLQKAKEQGFSNAFVFATKNGRRISLEKAEIISKTIQ